MGTESSFTEEVSAELGLRLVTGFAPKATHSKGTSGVLILCHPKLWGQRHT